MLGSESVEAYVPQANDHVAVLDSASFAHEKALATRAIFRGLQPHIASWVENNVTLSTHQQRPGASLI